MGWTSIKGPGCNFHEISQIKPVSFSLVVRLSQYVTV